MTQPCAHSLPTKFLHGALALVATYQLAFIGFVERPRNGAPGNLFYQFHEVVGLTTLGVVSAFWSVGAGTTWRNILAGIVPVVLVDEIAGTCCGSWPALGGAAPVQTA